ncbi:MAG: peptidylprolyl isomerase [Bacteroidota bacterium]
MNKFGRIILTLVVLFSLLSVQAQVKKKTVAKPAAKAAKKMPAKATAKKPVMIATVPAAETRVKIITDMGDIVIKLSNKTPLHRDNFIKLVTDHFYDSLLFHRVMSGFMIQGGDPESKNAAPGIMLGKGDIGYKIPAEFDSTLYHKKGALAAARNNNPEMASSGCQFYLVHGKKYSDEELNSIERQNNTYFSPAKRMTYKMVGGAASLDTKYTVFGEVESGLEVIDQIANVARDIYNRPTTDVHMRMELLTK